MSSNRFTTKAALSPLRTSSTARSTSGPTKGVALLGFLFTVFSNGSMIKSTDPKTALGAKAHIYKYKYQIT
jgi:hypothetical protein